MEHAKDIGFNGTLTGEARIITLQGSFAGTVAGRDYTSIPSLIAVAMLA
jgi:hypothetical protein